MNKKKKVLMVCESFGGGVFAYVSQLCNDLCNHFDVYLAYSIRPQTPKNYKDLIDKKVNLIEVPELNGLTFKKLIFSGKSIINALNKIQQDINPDIIHLHSSLAGGVGRIAFRNLKKPVLYTPHGYAFILLGPGLKSKLYYIFEKVLAQINNTISLTCCESEDMIAKTFSNRTYYIETGIDLASFSKLIPQKTDTSDTMLKVFTLGRICPQKRPDIFNAMAEQLPDVSFIWIGDGELRSKLTSKNIEITGWKNRNDALKIAMTCDVFVLCSYGEAIAMSLLENMFMKKICLVSNTVGNQSVIHNKFNGYVCDNIDDYVKAIKEIKNNYPHNYIQNAYNDMMNIYNTTTMTNKYVEYYNGLIDNRN